MKVQNCKGPGVEVEKQPKEAARYADPSRYVDQCLFGHISYLSALGSYSLLRSLPQQPTSTSGCTRNAKNRKLNE